MTAGAGRCRAGHPEDLGRMFVERASGGDLEGLVALCELGAVLALTSTRTPGGVTAEVTRRQRDGTRLWIPDRRDVLAWSGTGRTTS